MFGSVSLSLVDSVRSKKVKKPTDSVVAHLTADLAKAATSPKEEAKAAFTSAGGDHVWSAGF